MPFNKQNPLSFSTFLWTLTPVQNTGLSTFLATVVSGREHPQRHADFVGRVHPDGTRTSHTLPLPPFALPCAHARGEQTPTQLTGRLERGALTQAPFVRTAGARTVRLCVCVVSA